MNKLLTTVLSVILTLTLLGCDGSPATNKQIQANKAKEAANSLVFTENAEIDNIKNRLKLTSDPGAIGFILLLNESGQPIQYLSVKGKITSSTKRLTETDRIVCSGTPNCVVRSAASDEGTYGSSDPYIYFWTTTGSYMQWNGKYLYSDKPFRVRVEPLVVAVEIGGK